MLRESTILLDLDVILETAKSEQSGMSKSEMVEAGTKEVKVAEVGEFGVGPVSKEFESFSLKRSSQSLESILNLFKVGMLGSATFSSSS